MPTFDETKLELEATFAQVRIADAPSTVGAAVGGDYAEVRNVRAIEVDDEGVTKPSYFQIGRLGEADDWVHITVKAPAEVGNRKAIRDWVKDYPNRPWLRVMTMQYNVEFQSASLIVMGGTAQAPVLEYHLVAPAGASFRSMKTAERVSVI